MKKLLIKYIQKKMKPYLDGVTLEQQIQKVEEEQTEVRKCLGNAKYCFYSIRVLLFIMFNFHFEELYKLYVKDYYESECADFLIANCSLNYICNTHEGCTDHELSGFFDLYVQNLTDLLHLLMKVRYNCIRKDWKLNKEEKNKEV
jgi:hypothetical protein